MNVIERAALIFWSCSRLRLEIERLVLGREFTRRKSLALDSAVVMAELAEKFLAGRRRRIRQRRAAA